MDEDIIFVYDAAGMLTEEYPASTPTTVCTAYIYAGSRLLSAETSAGTNYLTADNLGTPRINTDASGNVTARHDYMPFGEEIATAQRTSGVGYAADTVRKQFTGYERDGETGLDFAQERYNNSHLGRFSSPDDFTHDTHRVDPASWNLYVYTRNNPLRMIDSSGQDAEVAIDKKKKTITITATFIVYGADGQGVTQEDLDRHKNLIKSQLMASYSGKYKDAGTEYTVSANITVGTAKDEAEAIRKVSGSPGNIVEIGYKSLTNVEGTKDAAASSFKYEGEPFDRMMVSINRDPSKDEMQVRNGYAHEFYHLLGGGGSEDDNDVAGHGRGPKGIIPSQLSENDKASLFFQQVFFQNKSDTRRASTVSKGYRIWKN